MKQLFNIQQWRYLWWLAIVLTGVITSSVVTVEPAHATSNYPEWNAGPPTVRVSDGIFTSADADAVGKGCTMHTIKVRDYAPASACVTEMDGWRYALFTHYYDQYGLTYSERFFVVGIGADTAMYVVDGLPTSIEPITAPGTDALVYRFGTSQIVVYDHFRRSLVRTGDGYSFTRATSAIVRDKDGAPINAKAIAISRGGGWLALETDRGIVRVSLTTMTTRTVSPLTTRYDDGYTPRMDLAISDDGQTIFVGGRLYAERKFAVITVTDGCSATTTPACTALDLTPLFTRAALPDGWPVGLASGTHGNRLDLYVAGFDGRYTEASVYPSGSAPPNLRYVALGDSFSSGEGDKGRQTGTNVSYYAPFTDDVATKEMCHLSSRSYPYILAGIAGLNPVGYGESAMRSVACSGARLSDIAGSSYLGQADRLKGKTTADLERLRNEALLKFIPGRLHQLDFVEEYQPRSLSLTIGGNDIQFSRIITACAYSLLTCDYASNATDRRNLGESIGSLYSRLTSLYAELTRADPAARIVAVGYPRFVNASSLICPSTTNLDLNERIMIDESIRYINDVIEASAASAGIGYADNENSLAGHRVCDEPGGFVNPIDFFDKDRFGTFHPNADGHRAMAQSIISQTGADIATHVYCADSHYPCPRASVKPELPRYFGDSFIKPALVALPSDLLGPVGPIVVKGTTFIVRTAIFAAGSSVKLELHSQPVVVGSGVVGSDGVFEQGIVLSDAVEPGYHTLHAYGVSASGEPLDVYEVIYVEASLPTGTVVVPDSPVATNSAPSSAVRPDSPTSTSSAEAPSAAAIIARLPDTFGRLREWWPIALMAVGAVIVGSAGIIVWRKRRR